MSMLKEFREFAVKGNVVDMAVGIIIGGAFGTIVASLVKDVIMPPIGLMLGGVDFSDIKIPLKRAAAGRDAVTMNIGVFLNNVISFLIVAFAVFMLVKAVNELRKRFETEKPKDPGRAAAVRGLSEGNPRRAGEEVDAAANLRGPRHLRTNGPRSSSPPPSTQNFEQCGWQSFTAPAANMPLSACAARASVDPISKAGS